VYTFLAAGEGEEQHLTYAALDQRASAVAAGLQRLGAEGERVLLLYPPGLDYIVGFLGCLYAGATAVPVYPPRPNRPMPRLLAIRASAQAKFALAPGALVPRVGAQLGPEVRTAPLEELETGGSWLNEEVTEDTPAFLQYTSGSTAEPKGVVLDHRNLLHNLHLIGDGFSLTPRDRAVFWLPPYHDMGLIGGILEPLYADYPVVLMAPVSFLQRPLRWLQAISRTRATVSGGPNFAYELCAAQVSEEQKRELDLSSWQVAFNGAEPVRAATLDRFADAFAGCGFRREAFMPCYGLAEATLLVSTGPRSSGAAVRRFDTGELERHRVLETGADGRTLVGCGTRQPGHEIAIVDASGTPSAPGEVGEIWVRGPSVARGYWNRPEITAATFGAKLAHPGEIDQGPYLRTGDLGFLSGGELFVTGRLKDLLILRGRNHYPQDLEASVETSHAALRSGHGAAFAVEVDGEERLVVVQEVERTRRHGDLSEVVTAIRGALAEEHEVQAHAVALLPPGALPKTSSGKVQRQATKAAFLAGSLDTVWTWQETGAETPEAEEVVTDGPAEWLAAELARRSRLPRAGIDAQRPLAEYPLDSLQVVQLLHAVEARWGFALPLDRFFDSLTLADLARFLEQPSAAPPASAPQRVGPEHGDHPLAHNQLSLWFLHQLDPLSPAYNVPSAVRLRGPVDTDALRRSFQTLVDRHAALRTTFPIVDGEPRQRVAESATVWFTEENAAEALSARLAEEARRPFDLSAGPLLRVILFRHADETVLFVAFHHIVVDLWSLGLLLEELGSLYPEITALPEPPLRYTDAVAWQRERLAGPEGERLWAWWQERLSGPEAGELPTLSLRTDRPRPMVQTYSGATFSRALDPRLTGRIKEIGRGRQSTSFVTLAAAFEVLLHRITGDNDLLVGTVAHGRSDAALARVVGYFVDALVLRAGFAGDPSFAAFLDAARRDVLGAFEHQGLPFPLLVERLQPERDASRSPLFQVLCVWQRAELADGQDLTGFALGVPAAVNLGGLRLESLPLDLGLAQFDLTLALGETGGSLVADFDYNTDLFDAVTVERLAERFATLLEGIAADPECPVSALPLLTAAEERQLLVEINGTGAGFPREASLADLVMEQAESTPDAVAVICGEDSLTYGELQRRAGRLAGRLAAMGIEPEELVAVCLERSTDLVAASLGVLMSGAAYLPLDPEEPVDRLAAILGDAGVRRAITQEEVRPRLPAGLETLTPWPPLPHALTPARERGNGGASLACVIYTSGSTGRPKGVLLTHRSLVNLVGSFVESYRPGGEDRILPLTSIAHASFLGELYPLLCSGGTVVLPRRRELLEREARLEIIRRHRVTIVSTVPSMAADLNALRDEMPHVRLLLVGGEALAVADVDRLLATAEIVNGYGLTETAVCSTIHRLRPADLARRRLPVGRPVRNTRVYVLDRGFRLLPPGAAGELYVAGEGLARGYLGEPARTAERFLPDPFAPSPGAERMYRTGDLCLWLADGDLECLGRVDQQVKVRGFRIEPDEIEAVLATHPKVRDAAVALHQDASGRPRLAAWVVPDEADLTSLTAGDLLAYLRERLPDPMVPSAVVFLDELPTGPTGKVDLRKLPAPPAPGDGAGKTGGVPRSSLERRIAEVWREILGVESVGIHDNFFDLGGHSLMLTRLHARLQEVLGQELALVTLYQFPTVSALAESLAGGAEPEARAARRGRSGTEGREIAIIGMAGRFPGAANVPDLWRNVTAGVESIRRFTDEELLAAGTNPALVANPNYVKAKGILGDVEMFDAQFFGLNPREVELMDPQHRIFLEICWEAMERAAIDPDRYPGPIGVFAGESMNTYMLMNLLPHMELVASAETLQASLGNDKDPLTSRVAYKLNLKGPSLTVQTASSTSLSSVHTACRFLLQGDCDMALAGGVSIHLPEVSGYMYEEGGTTARDGHCRAFDAQATGFVSGHGAGVVVLKRLADALADGDHIHAVIKGSACNNDGSLKVSFMAPSVEGQVDVYTRAYEDAGVSPETVSYVECHGTATSMGDPIEITSLTRAFAAHTDRKGFCAIGSLKTNIGHLDTAAGVSGLIKAALALEHKTLPASLHFESPNPRIDFANSPFFVNAVTRPWEVEAGPRRAGVTSLGMGGTNVHMVLEEPPPRVATTPSRPWQLFLLSARSPKALDTLTLRVADHLESDRNLDPATIADIAWSLQVGRKPLPFRRMLLAADREEAAGRLSTLDPEHVLTAAAPPGDRPVAFLLSGQGSQYPNMGRGLYDAEPSFRDDVDLCCRLLQPHLGLDLREVLFVQAEFVEAEAAGKAGERLQQTALAQPALFVISYATARLWMSWGVRPAALLGHSLGEYVAACLAGVISLEDALAVVALRGSLMQRMPPGAMLAVPLREEEVLPLLGERLALAAVNGPAACVVSGPADAVEALRERLENTDGLTCRRLHTSHAFHSSMMDPILAPLRERLRKARLSAPRIPYLSNVTGTWIRPEEATDPEYWVRQLRQAVRFADGVAALLEEPRRILVEVGPGDALATMSRRHPARGPEHTVIASLRHPKEAEPDLRFLLNALGRLWLAGGTVSWEGFYVRERRQRTPLPTYPFERRRFWVDPGTAVKASAPQKDGRRELADWFWVPGWKQSALPGVPWGGAAAAAPASWLVFVDTCGLGAQLVERLEAAGHRVATVRAGGRFQHLGQTAFEIDPGREEDYELLLSSLGEPPTRALHLWNVGLRANIASLDLSFYSLVFLGKALVKRGGDAPFALGVVADGLYTVTGEEQIEPLKAALLGPCAVLPREHPWLTCRVLDVSLGARAADQILAEMEGAPTEPVIAWRRHLRWAPHFEATPLPERPAPLRHQGVYLLTGGLGGLGLALARHLAGTVQARLVLVGRSSMPERDAWDEWIEAHGEDDRTSRRLRHLQALEEQGAEVLTVSADVTDPEQMRAVRTAAEARFGAVHGVIHAAGVPGMGMLRGKTRDEASRVLAPKVDGTLALHAAFEGAGLDFFVLFSSITAALPEIGQADYVAANSFLDAFARRAGAAGESVLSIGWDAWRESGMAVETEVPKELAAWRRRTLAQGLTDAEGVEAFSRVLAAGLPEVIVSTLDLAARRAENARPVSLEEIQESAAGEEPAMLYPRSLATPYMPPEGDLERHIAEVWQEILGVDKVGALDNFFELGGNSLAGIRVTRILRERFDVSLSDVSLYEASTVRALARLLAPPSAEPVEVEDESRSRGERRRKRLAERRTPGTGA
jgi:amino acid adenylation domain-containing protein